MAETSEEDERQIQPVLFGLVTAERMRFIIRYDGVHSLKTVFFKKNICLLQTLQNMFDVFGTAAESGKTQQT